jgi:hypothetical protein
MRSSSRAMQVIAQAPPCHDYIVCYICYPGNWLMKNVLKLRYNLYKTKFTLKKDSLQNKTYIASYIEWVKIISDPLNVSRYIHPILLMLLTFHNQQKWKNIP